MSSAQNKRVARALKKGRNPIAGFGAISRRALATRNGPKSSETDHLQDDQFSGFSGLGGRHHAPSAQGASKNSYGSMNSPAVGRHASRAETGPRHAYNPPARAQESAFMHDLKGAVRDRQGTGYVGKHRKPGA